MNICAVLRRDIWQLWTWTKKAPSMEKRAADLTGEYILIKAKIVRKRETTPRWQHWASIDVTFLT